MDTGTLTLISGIVLLLVFALAGLSARRRRNARDGKAGTPDA